MEDEQLRKNVDLLSKADVFFFSQQFLAGLLLLCMKADRPGGEVEKERKLRKHDSAKSSDGARAIYE